MRTGSLFLQATETGIRLQAGYLRLLFQGFQTFVNREDGPAFWTFHFRFPGGVSAAAHGEDQH
jgi:hypothetical protein